MRKRGLLSNSRRNTGKLSTFDAAYIELRQRKPKMKELFIHRVRLSTSNSNQMTEST
jgi:ribosomal protein L20